MPMSPPIQMSHPATFGQNQRQRKQLPPLASPPTELSMAAASSSSSSPMPSSDDGESSASKSEVEQLLRNHLSFARAFKLNDAAILMPFLDKRVTLLTHDGSVYEGVSAVLGWLVGPKMSKLSGGLHIKGTPMKSGAWQSAFVYEHGLVFKEPLYSETVTWKPQGNVITAITHTRLSSSSNPHHDVVCPPKSVADVVKAVAMLPHRLSTSDEDNATSEDNTNTPHELRRRSSCSRTSISSSSFVTQSDAATTCITDTNANDTTTTGVLITRIAVVSTLSPIRKRRLVNAFLTVETPTGDTLWKSSVAKKQTLPVWSGVDVQDDEEGDQPDMALHPLSLILTHANIPVVVTLWDYGFFRSLRVATVQLTAAQLLKDAQTGQTIVDLLPTGLSATPIQLSFSITRQGQENDNDNDNDNGNDNDNDNDDEWRPSRTPAAADQLTATPIDKDTMQISDNLSFATILLVLLVVLSAAVLQKYSWKTKRIAE